jgi:ABC-type Fe3+-hydroxamate transport system substrate-binding protein
VNALFSLLLLLCLATSAQARELLDATGAHVKLVPKPHRIVTLAPSLAELAADLSGKDLDRIVGVSEYTDEPPGLTHVASIGRYDHFNLEAVIGLKPDLVLATSDGNSKEQVLRLRELGLPVVVVATGSLKEVLQSIQIVGKAMGETESALAMTKHLDEGLKRLREQGLERAKRLGSPRVLLQIGDEPLVVVGGSGFLQEMLELVGAKNVYADNDTRYPRPSLEDVLKKDPDAIVVLALGHDVRPFKRMGQRWTEFPSLKAVRNKRIRVLQGDPILRPTLRLLEGATLLEKAVYGEK